MRRFKYERVIQYIHSEYIDNPLFVSGKLPSEPELAKELGISRFPVNQAYNQLVEKGEITKISGLGAFIRGREPRNYSHSRNISRMAGIVCGSSLPPQIHEGLCRGLEEHGIGLVSILTDYWCDNGILARINELNIQYLFIIPRVCFDEVDSETLAVINKIIGRGVIPIIIERQLAEYTGIQIVVDNAGGTAMGVEWMLDHGAEKVAYIGKADYLVGRERYKGYLNALRNNGIEVDPDLVVLDSSRGNFENSWSELVDRGMEKILNKFPDCKNFAVFSYQLAYLAFQYLKRNGLFDETVSIVGYDSYPHFDEEFRNCYICLERPFYQIGLEAAGVLTETISNDKRINRVVKRILPEMHFSRDNAYANCL